MDSTSIANKFNESTRGTIVPSLVKIHSRDTSGHIGEMSLSCDFFLRHAQRSNPLTHVWLKMRGITQGCAIFGLKYLILTFDPYLPRKNVKFWPQNSNFKPKWWNMKVQVYQKLLNEWTWKFDSMLRTWNSVLRCNMMTSQQIQYGGRPPYWKSTFGYISTIYCSINMKFGA